MGNRTFQADYGRHEYIYAAHPNASGWNDATVDQEILTYVRELLDQAQLLAPASLLELGCGMGNLALPLAEAGFRVVGIDISATAIEVATQRALGLKDRVSFRVGDVTCTEAYGGLEAFDCILDGLCWHCIIGLDRRVFLNLVRNALKPQGCLLLITMCGEPRSARLQTRFDSTSRLITNGCIAERYLGQPQDLEAELNDAGFDITYRRLVAGNNHSGDQDMFLAVAKAD